MGQEQVATCGVRAGSLLLSVYVCGECILLQRIANIAIALRCAALHVAVCMYRYIYMYIYVCMYVCMYVCVCVCAPLRDFPFGAAGAHQLILFFKN